MNFRLIISIFVIVSIFILFLVLCIAQYSKLTKLKAMVNESFSTLEIFLEKRLEIVMQLLDKCDEKANKDKEIENLLNIVTMLKQNIKTQRRFKLENSLDNAIKSSQNVLNEFCSKHQQLLFDLNTVQSDINSSKNYYNNNVENYNKKINKFPIRIVARIFKFSKAYFIK